MFPKIFKKIPKNSQKIPKKFPKKIQKCEPKIRSDYHPIAREFHEEMTQIDIEAHFNLLESEFAEKRTEKSDIFSVFGDRCAWICKPAASCCGKRIAILSKRAEILRYIWEEENCVIQKYIERPFLIQNRKFDLRQWFLGEFNVIFCRPFKIERLLVSDWLTNQMRLTCFQLHHGPH